MKKENVAMAKAIEKAREEMRLKVIDLEMKARYWKAQHDIRHYTLQAEKIQPEYDKYLEQQMEKNAELEKLYMDQLKKNQEEGLTMKHIITQEDLDSNPELIQEGVQVGDEIDLGPQVEPTVMNGDPSETE